MERKYTLHELPDEILELVLNNDSISPSDLCNCSLVCKSLLYVCRRDIIWRHKFHHFYPTLYKFIKEDSWYDGYIKVVKLKKRLITYILALSQTFLWSMYHDYEWPDIPRRALALYENLFDDTIKHGCGKYYIVDECYNIMHASPAEKNLTLKYYAEKLYYHINENYIVEDEWERFLNKDEASTKTSYEEGLLIASQSLQPTIRLNLNLIQHKLQGLSSKVEKRLVTKYPHLISREKIQNILMSSRSSWSAEVCSIILEEIHTFMKHDSNFIINGTFDYCPDNYCVDRVLNNMKGSSKILISLEACIAIRLGVMVQIHKSKSESLLDSWKLQYTSHDGVEGYAKECSSCKDTLPYAAIDLDWSNDGQLVDSVTLCRTLFAHLVFLAECRLRGEWWQAGEPVVHDLLIEETYSQPIGCLFSSWKHVEHWKVSQLRHYRCQLKRVSPNQLNVTGKILHLNILLRINSKLTQEALLGLRREIEQPPSTLKDLIRMVGSVNMRAKNRINDLKPLLTTSGNMYSLSSYTSLSPFSSGPWIPGWQGGEIPQKRRLDRMSWQVHFAVGQVLEQRNGGLCVVYDWDSMCVESEDTLILMGETSLAHGTDQPFYRVLMNNGIVRYIAQENLRQSLNPTSISNPLLGRYFTAFLYPHYIPNPQKAYEYPEDATVREQNALALNLL